MQCRNYRSRARPWKWFAYCAVTYLSQCVLCFPLAPSEAPGSVDGKALSATEAIVSWSPLSQSNIDGYQVSREFHDMLGKKIKDEL